MNSQRLSAELYDDSDEGETKNEIANLNSKLVATPLDQSSNKNGESFATPLDQNSNNNGDGVACMDSARRDASKYAESNKTRLLSDAEISVMKAEERRQCCRDRGLIKGKGTRIHKDEAAKKLREWRILRLRSDLLNSSTIDDFKGE
ncbi:MAG: hypothetical protein ACREBR_01355 [bacterium]